MPHPKNDVHFIIPISYGKNISICSNKRILAGKSSYFLNLFNETDTWEKKEIEISISNPNRFKDIIRGLTCGFEGIIKGLSCCDAIFLLMTVFNEYNANINYIDLLRSMNICENCLRIVVSFLYELHGFMTKEDIAFLSDIISDESKNIPNDILNLIYLYRNEAMICISNKRILVSKIEKPKDLRLSFLSKPYILEINEHISCFAASMQYDGLISYGTFEGKLVIANLKSKKIYSKIEHKEAIHDIQISKDGSFLVYVSGMNIQIIKIMDSKIAGKISSKIPIKNISLLSNKNLVAGSDIFGNIIIWNYESGEILFTEESSVGESRICSFSPDGEIFAFESEKGMIKLINTCNWMNIYELKNHRDKVRIITFSKESKYMVSGGDDGRVYLYAMEDIHLMHRLKFFNRSQKSYKKIPDPILGICFSIPEDKIIVSLDNRIILWDILSGSILETKYRRCEKLNISIFPPK